MNGYRIRIVERRIVPVGELRQHPKNWKIHGTRQRDVVARLLEKIGIVDSLLVYPSARAGGALTLINGHLRQDIGGEWPVDVTDLTDEEADLLLSALDPSVTLAETDSALLLQLIGGLQAEATEGQADDVLLTWLTEVQEEAGELAQTKLAEASARPGGQRGTYGATVKLVVVAQDVYDIERALAATGQRNRAEAIIEVARFYLENHAKGQQYTQLEGLATAQPTGSD